MTSMKHPNEDRDTRIGKAMVGVGRWFKDTTIEIAVALGLAAPIVWIAHGMPGVRDTALSTAEAYANAEVILALSVTAAAVSYGLYRLVSGIVAVVRDDDRH